MGEVKHSTSCSIATAEACAIVLEAGVDNSGVVVAQVNELGLGGAWQDVGSGRWLTSTCLASDLSSPGTPVAQEALSWAGWVLPAQGRARFSLSEPAWSSLLQQHRCATSKTAVLTEVHAQQDPFPLVIY